MNKPILWGAGAVVGLILGYLTRPTFLGFSVPVSVMFSSAPGDAEFRSSMWLHMGFATLGGAIALGVLGTLLLAARR